MASAANGGILRWMGGIAAALVVALVAWNFSSVQELREGSAAGAETLRRVDESLGRLEALMDLRQEVAELRARVESFEGAGPRYSRVDAEHDQESLRRSLLERLDLLERRCCE